MKIIRFPRPLRFKTEQDCNDFYNSQATGKTDWSKTIPTYIERDGAVTINPEYEADDFEVAGVILEEDKQHFL